MRTLIPLLTRLQCRDRGERGAGMIEYGLLLALIAMVVLAAVTALGGTTSSTYSEVTSQLG